MEFKDATFKLVCEIPIDGGTKLLSKLWASETHLYSVWPGGPDRDPISQIGFWNELGGIEKMGVLRPPKIMKRGLKTQKLGLEKNYQSFVTLFEDKDY